jgi:hypothetical protein
MALKDATTDEKLKGAREGAARQIQRIRDRRELTDAAKQVEIAKIHRAHKQVVAALEVADAEERASTLTSLTAKAFGVRDLAKGDDKTAVIVSHRDALDRAEKIGDPREAKGLLARATTHGDEPLARAVAWRAHNMTSSPLFGADNPWEEVLSDYIQTRPVQHQAIEDLRGMGTGDGLNQIFRFAVAAPPELSHVRSDSQLDAIADSDSGVAATG